jgi:hypothetical protein
MLYGGECVDVFLVNGSPQERGRKAKEILQHQGCRIVLCSIQYSEAVRETLDYITEEKFDMFVQWLNPGRHDADKNSDTLGLMPWLLDHNATVSVRDGKIDAGGRTEEIRQFIHGWAKARQLVFACQSGGGCGD